MLYIHNSATKQKELFKPIIPGKVSMYVCGMTVYDYCHIGHGRIFVVFDVVARYLRASGYALHYVRNITDIDDKIINRAHENGETIDVLTQRFIDASEEDERALGVLPPDERPRATHHLADIITMIEKLIENGLAYIAANGDVYYEVSKFKDYGKFSHQSLMNLKRGVRIDILDDKHDPLDFALWKLAKPGEPSWDSPWGKGRPGWHIECSAMIYKCMGENIDIHGGGLDLVFPHHQNELAQSQGALEDAHFVNVWMHLGYVQINREKMSKSLNNFFTIRDVLKQYHPEVVRYFMLASHYRSPINYSHENLASAREALERLYISIRDLALPDEPIGGDLFVAQFNAAMDDDFNTSVALSVLFELARDINRLRDTGELETAAGLGARLRQLAAIFGILTEDPQTFLQSGTVNDEVEKIENLIAARNLARANKHWAEADKLRDQLLEIGVIIEDGAEGTNWRKS